ncbi:unnamed protein product [Trichogramma brassicae]|uniref:Uncharacterized protein n=1 Tax=Trichogramma brassicae TaxID=86971 RepID=A0A6H5I5N6_9HYME|nr:unnamed protein product [Trichogramma brassicae]
MSIMAIAAVIEIVIATRMGIIILLVIIVAIVIVIVIVVAIVMMMIATHPQSIAQARFVADRAQQSHRLDDVQGQRIVFQFQRCEIPAEQVALLQNVETRAAFQECLCELDVELSQSQAQRSVSARVTCLDVRSFLDQHDHDLAGRFSVIAETVLGAALAETQSSQRVQRRRQLVVRPIRIRAVVQQRFYDVSVPESGGDVQRRAFPRSEIDVDAYSDESLDSFHVTGHAGFVKTRVVVLVAGISSLGIVRATSRLQRRAQSRLRQDPVVAASRNTVARATRYWRLPRISLVAAELFKIYNRLDVNYSDEDGLTHFHVACVYECNEVVGGFLELGQDPNLLTKRGDSPLHSALNKPRNQSSETIELLLRAGADPNLADAGGLTPLHYIGLGNYDDLAETFFAINDELGQTVRVDAQDRLGSTALLYAADEGHKSLIKTLLRRGADPNVYDDQGSTPLHAISMRSDGDELLRIFFELCAEVDRPSVQVDARQGSRWTPLQSAVAYLLPRVIDALLDHGADLSIFVFPAYISQACELSNSEDYDNRNLSIASRALAVVECLEKRGYRLTRSDVITLMKVFSFHELFENSSDLGEHWYDDDEESASQAKDITVKPSLSLYDLIRSSPNEAAKLVTHQDYLELACSGKLCELPEEYEEACEIHLCEKLSRGFFRKWALDPFMELIHYRLPILCCESIVEQLTNEDLYRICKAARSPKPKGSEKYVKRCYSPGRPVRATKRAPKRLQYHKL